MDTLLIKRRDVAKLLTIEECIVAVEKAFELRALGTAVAPGILGIHSTGGGFHIKAGALNLARPYFVAKLNANFPQNTKLFGLPTIQGIILVSNAENGIPLAVMDSMEVTIIRTGAATAVATKYLSRQDSSIATICGCGNQGKISLKAIMKVRALKTVYAFDLDPSISRRFANDLSDELHISVVPADNLMQAVSESHICVTCTSSNNYFIRREFVSPGTFIAAVGSDSENKQEIEPALIASGKLVVDSLEQCAQVGELHHALELNIMARENVHANIGEIITGQKEGRTSAEEVIIFDSTGTGLQDVAAASIVYERALEKGIGMKYDFAQ